MKLLLALTFLTVSAPFCLAQSTPSSSPTTIDPSARDLLARLNARYKRFRSFQGVIELRMSEPVPWRYNRLRVQLTPFTGVVSSAIPGQGTEKRVFDGHTELLVNSRFPRVFQSRTLNAPGLPIGPFLKQAGVEGTTTNLLSNNGLAALFLEPDLKSVSLGPTETLDGQPVQTVEIKMEGNDSGVTLKLFIDSKNLLLRRVEGQEKIPLRATPFSFSEAYSQIKFDEPLLESLFSTKAPAGFKRVADFPGEAVQATKPVVSVVRE